MTQQPIPWFDQALDTRERKILTYDRHGIPGLRMIGCHNTSHATAPLPPHYHRDCFEFTYVVQGNLTFHVDHRHYELSGGDLFLTFPDEIHDTGNAPMSLHRMYWFQLDVRCPEGMLGLEGAFARKLIAALSGLDCRVVRMDPAAEGLFKAAFADLYGAIPLGDSGAVPCSPPFCARSSMTPPSPAPGSARISPVPPPMSAATSMNGSPSRIWRRKHPCPSPGSRRNSKHRWAQGPEITSITTRSSRQRLCWIKDGM